MGAYLFGAKLNDADLESANLVGAYINGGKLNAAKLVGTKLNDADFSSSIGLSVNQVIEAQNWQQAKYSDDFQARLPKL